MPKYLVSIMVLCCISCTISGQTQDLTEDTKRKNVEVSNYTLFLHLHDMAIEYSTKLDFKIDSLFKEHQVVLETNLFDFRIRALQSMQHVLYKSDPVIAFIDGWIYGVQMLDYLGTTEARNYLGSGHSTLLALYMNFLNEFPESYIFLTGTDPSNMSANVTQFAKDHPIIDSHLNRTSITDATAQWVGESSIGFKSGVATITDALRNISDRLNYHAEFTPKIMEWNVERSIASIIGTDSINQLIYSVTDTVLADLDRQRWETLGFFSSERKAVLNQISIEREILFEKMVEERLAVERLIQQEREASLSHFEQVIKETSVYSFDRFDSMVDRIFFKVLILMAVMAAGLVLAVVVYKKM